MIRFAFVSVFVLMIFTACDDGLTGQAVGGIHNISSNETKESPETSSPFGNIAPLVDIKTKEDTDSKNRGKRASVFSKITGVTSKTPTPTPVPAVAGFPTPMPALIIPGVDPTPLPTPLPNRDLVGMPLLVNGEPLEAYQETVAIPCGFIHLYPPANEKGRYYMGTKIIMTVYPFEFGTKVILGVANSSGGNTPTGTINAQNARPYSTTASVTPCSSPITTSSYNTYDPDYYLSMPTPMPTSTLPPLTPRPYSVASIRKYLSDGERLYNLGQFDSAILEFDQIILDRPLESEGSQEAYTWRAKSHVALGNWKEALLDVGAALAADPTGVEDYHLRDDVYKALNVEQFRLRAKIYMELNNYENAILAWDQVISRASAPIAADYHSRGYAHYMREQYHRAVGDLTEAILIEPTQTRFELRGASYYYSGKDMFKVQYQNAISDFEEAIRMNSTSDLVAWRSAAYSKLHQFD